MENPSIDAYNYFKSVEEENFIDDEIAEIIEKAFDNEIVFTYNTSVWQDITGPLAFVGDKIQFYRDVYYMKDDYGNDLKFTKISMKVKNTKTDSSTSSKSFPIFETMLGKNIGYRVKNLNAAGRQEYQVIIPAEKLKV